MGSGCPLLQYREMRDSSGMRLLDREKIVQMSGGWTARVSRVMAAQHSREPPTVADISLVQWPISSDGCPQKIFSNLPVGLLHCCVLTGPAQSSPMPQSFPSNPTASRHVPAFRRRKLDVLEGWKVESLHAIRESPPEAANAKRKQCFSSLVVCLKPCLITASSDANSSTLGSRLSHSYDTRRRSPACKQTTQADHLRIIGDRILPIH